jgi:hypothetical protein
MATFRRSQWRAKTDFVFGVAAAECADVSLKARSRLVALLAATLIEEIPLRSGSRAGAPAEL